MRRRAWRSSWDTTSSDTAVAGAPVLAGAAWQDTGAIDAEFLPDMGELHRIGELDQRQHLRTLLQRNARLLAHDDQAKPWFHPRIRRERRAEEPGELGRREFHERKIIGFKSCGVGERLQELVPASRAHIVHAEHQGSCQLLFQTKIPFHRIRNLWVGTAAKACQRLVGIEEG